MEFETQLRNYNPFDFFEFCKKHRKDFKPTPFSEGVLYMLDKIDTIWELFFENGELTLSDKKDFEKLNVKRHRDKSYQRALETNDIDLSILHGKKHFEVSRKEHCKPELIKAIESKDNQVLEKYFSDYENLMFSDVEFLARHDSEPNRRLFYLGICTLIPVYNCDLIVLSELFGDL